MSSFEEQVLFSLKQINDSIHKLTEALAKSTNVSTYYSNPYVDISYKPINKDQKNAN